MINDSDLLDIYINEDFITSDKFLNHTRICGLCKYSKTDLFWLGGPWRGIVKKSILVENQHKANTLIFGHSDHPVTRAKLIASKFKGYKTIYGINLNPILRNTYSLPLGLTNNTDESPMHRLLGETSTILESIRSTKRPTSYVNSLYASFSISNNRGERGQIASILEKSNNRVHLPDISKFGRSAYMRALRSANYVICPEGNGIDTHRLWETLYVGGTPVVKSNPTINSLLQDLPVLVVEEWSELEDVSTMQHSWERIQNEHHESKFLRASYWESIFWNTHNK